MQGPVLGWTCLALAQVALHGDKNLESLELAVPVALLQNGALVAENSCHDVVEMDDDFLAPIVAFEINPRSPDLQDIVNDFDVDFHYIANHYDQKIHL